MGRRFHGMAGGQERVPQAFRGDKHTDCLDPMSAPAVAHVGLPPHLGAIQLVAPGYPGNTSRHNHPAPSSTVNGNLSSICHHIQAGQSSPKQSSLHHISAHLAWEHVAPTACDRQLCPSVCVCFVPFFGHSSPSGQGETRTTLCSVLRGLHLFSAFFSPTRNNRGHTGGA